MVRKLMVPFSPKQISNPVLQRHYAAIEALALNREAIEDVPDHTIPNTAAIKRRAAKEIDAFKEACKLNELTAEKKCRLDTTESGRGRDAQITSTQFNLTEDELRKVVDENKLSKLTVPQLRQALHLLHCTPSGTKKADLMDQIKKYFSM
ncbi:unnamed protein product [Echinostoma caproni]|uniref:Ku70/Ku80 C-terminal arm domain-containing protein n=1 Tax=Echinostoma caproni TaxID=27848 RepID=A0A3P8IBE1_9TREM|nr:unnamed protein product [Echinostoma caproni]